MRRRLVIHRCRTMRRRAFTLIEMVVVISVLAGLAALIAPSFVAAKRSRERRVLEAAVLRLPAEARAVAQKEAVKTTLRVDGNTLVIEQTAIDAKDAEPTEVKRVALSNDLTLASAEIDGESVDLSAWVWEIYPDGSAQTAQLTLSEGSATQKILILSKKGEAHWATPDEALANPKATESWQAGELEKRNG
jgi:prepilin-type N-terminal cleavage/methylation domain-containing protein